jgi:hypothetical protein
MGMGGLSRYRIFKQKNPTMDNHGPPEQIHHSNTIQKFRNYMVHLMDISPQRSGSLDLVYSSQVSWVKNHQ